MLFDAMSGRRLLDVYPDAASWTDDVTVVGHGMQLTGSLTSPGTVVVAGRFDGEIVCDRLVRVMPGGVVKGPVRAEAVLVEGAVDGDIAAARHVELARTGRVRGDVTGPRVAVAEGAYLQGRLRATDGRIQRYREKRRG
jgi:cytoskeletal protein CcmA (bactofilin family)